MTPAMSGVASINAIPRLGPRTNAAFDMASASVPSSETIVALSEAGDGFSV
jgi:hypothetical protein